MSSGCFLAWELLGGMAGVAVLALLLYSIVAAGSPVGQEEAGMMEHVPGGSLDL